MRAQTHSNVIEIYEKEVSGLVVYTSSTPETTLEDIFEVRVKGTTVEYLKNNAVFYTSKNTASFPLYVRSAIKYGGIKNVKIYKYEQSTISPTILSEYSQQNIQWNLNKTKNINFNTDGTITRYATITDYTYGWYSYTVATEKIYQNNEIYQGIKCSANQTYGYVVFGLKTSEKEMIYGNESSVEDAVTYGFYMNAHTNTSGTSVSTNNSIRIKENGTNIKDFNESASANNPNNTNDGYLQNYTTDDIFEVRVKGKQVEYLINNIVIYYSTIEATYPLYPCIITFGAWNGSYVNSDVGIKNVQLDINHSPYAAKSELTWDESNSHYIDFNSNGSITSNLSNDWRSRTISHQLIHYNPNLIQYSFSNKYALIGT